MSGGPLVWTGEDGAPIDVEWTIDRLSRCLAVPVQEIYNEAYGAAPKTGPYTRAAPPTRPITDEERADVARYGALALGEMRDLSSLLADLGRRADDLAPLVVALDRRESGDDGDGTVWEEILSWGRARPRQRPAHDPELCARLAREAREDDERMSEVPWQSDMPGGAFGGRLMISGTGRAATVVALLHAGTQEAIARTRNNLRATADQLEAMRARIAELEAANERLAASQPTWSQAEVTAQRDALIQADVQNRTRIRDLEVDRDCWRSQVVDLSTAGKRAVDGREVAELERDAALVRAESLAAEVRRVRSALTQWRTDVHDACLDHGWGIEDRIDQILGPPSPGEADPPPRIEVQTVDLSDGGDPPERFVLLSGDPSRAKGDLVTAQAVDSGIDVRAWYYYAGQRIYNLDKGIVLREDEIRRLATALPGLLRDHLQLSGAGSRGSATP